MRNWTRGGTELSSRGSEKVSVSTFAFTVAEVNRGAVLSAGVSLVTALPEKPGTGSLAKLAYRSGFVSGAV